MFDFRQYIIAVTAAAIVGCLAISICGDKGTASAVIKLIVGVIMTLTILKPLIRIEIADFTQYLGSLEASASDSVQDGSAWADSSIVKVIKEQSEAYILDKASSMGAQIHVDITVQEYTPYIPVSATVAGSISPYAKKQLSLILEQDIGILKENQIWTQ